MISHFLFEASKNDATGDVIPIAGYWVRSVVGSSILPPKASPKEETIFWKSKPFYFGH